MSHSTKSVLHGVLMTLVAIGCGRDCQDETQYLGFMKERRLQEIPLTFAGNITCVCMSEDRNLSMP